MSLKLVLEDERSEVEFLQMKIGRSGENGDCVYLKWSQKEYSAKRILDFQSFHPWRMKVNVVREFIRTILRLTSFRLWNISVNLLILIIID